MPPPSRRPAVAPPQATPQSILRCRVSTARALCSPVAAALLRAVHKRLAVALAAPDDAEVALHEAVLNAAIHGNLGVTWSGAEPAAALDGFLAAVAERLQDTALATRMIAIEVDRCADRLYITVRDEGAGFAPSAGSAGSRTAPHGRGLLLMRAAGRVEHRRGGREVRLSLPLRAPGGDP